MKRFLKRLAELTYVAAITALLIVFFLLAAEGAMHDPLTKMRPTSGHQATTCNRVMT